jgi:hypothetical protein
VGPFLFLIFFVYIILSFDFYKNETMKKDVYILVLTFVVVLTSCTPSSKLMSSWKPEESESKNYSKIGVMVLSPKTTNRLAAEDVIVTQFKEKNVSAVPTYAVFPLAGKMEMPADTSAESKELMDGFKQKVRDNNYDALMLVTMIDKKKEQRYVQGMSVGVGVGGYYGGGSYYGSNYYGNNIPYAGSGYAGQPGYASYYSYNMGNMYEPGYYVEDVTYYIEFTLYDVATEKLLWAGQTKTVNFSSINRERSLLAGIAVNEILKREIVIPNAVEKKK